VGQIKSGKNRILITRTGHRYPPEAFKVWRDAAVGDLVKQWRQPAITVPVRLYCTYWPGDRRTRDVSGMIDAMFHVLVKAGVLKDDGLVWDCLWYRQHMNKKGPKVLITISELGL
jgi:Holliday junction resolvase RusA-like endonuclease